MSEAPPEEPPPDPEDTPGRAMPHDRDAEQWVLSAMLQDNGVIGDVIEALRPGDYYAPAHETIHDAIVDLFARGQPADVVTVKTELEKAKSLDRVGGAMYLYELLHIASTTLNATYYAEIVAHKAVRRRLIEVSQRNMQRGYETSGDLTDLIDQAEADMLTVSTLQRSHDYKPLGEVVMPVVDHIDALASGDLDLLTATPTGFLDLDELLGGGLGRGQSITIAGRPGSGKSVLGVDFLRSCALRHHNACALFSLEMSTPEVVTRILAAESKVLLNRLRNGQLDDSDWARIAAVVARLQQAPMFIDDSPNLTMTEIRAKARRLKQQHDLRLIVIDYLQLMTSGKKVESRQVEVSEFSRQIKLLAKELEVPVVALSQLNRGPEQRSDKRPNLADLRESGAIEQDSDVVILVHRDDYFDRESPRAGEADLIVAKHRNGSTRDVVVSFQGHYSRFVDMYPG